MKRVFKGMAAGAVTGLLVLLPVTESQAAVSHLKSDSGKSYKGCKNSVVMWRDGGKMFAYSKLTCSKRQAVVRASVALSGENGKTFTKSLDGCKLAKTCTSKTISLKGKKNWTFRASGDGTASGPDWGEGDLSWPTSSVAHVSYKYA
ncbi:hypothetical protein [Streptomyces sp. NPDC005865]|uniref:hypothetical protein n=1 Tax=Streptomyces sp. NPDC005865 TaxID=3155453 RepID=UPI0033DF0789